MLGWGEGGRLSVQGGNGCCTGKSTVTDTGTCTGTGGKEKDLENGYWKYDYNEKFKVVNIPTYICI